MTVRKRFKRLVRARARETGESCTSALAYFRRDAEDPDVSDKSSGRRTMKSLPRGHTLADLEREAGESGLPDAATARTQTSWTARGVAWSMSLGPKEARSSSR